MDKKASKREMILDVALELFSQKGFYATSIDEIGEKAGLKGPALYYYFKGKDAIIDGLCARMEEYYGGLYESVSDIKTYPKDMHEMRELALKRIMSTMHDPKIQMGRRMLNMGQYSDERLSEITTNYYLKSLVALHEEFFKKMIAEGKVKDYPPEILAFEWVAPVTMLIHTYDREPKDEAGIIEAITRHMDHLVEVYSID